MEKDFEITILENLGWLHDLKQDYRFTHFTNLPTHIQIVKVPDKDTLMLKEHCPDQQVRSHPSQNLWMIRHCEGELLSGNQRIKFHSFEANGKSKIGIRFSNMIRVTVVENLGWITDLQSNPVFTNLAINMPRQIQIVRLTKDDTSNLTKQFHEQLIVSEMYKDLWMIWCSNGEIPRGEVVLRAYEYESKSKVKQGLKYISCEKPTQTELDQKEIHRLISKCHRDLAYYHELLSKMV